MLGKGIYKISLEHFHLPANKRYSMNDEDISKEDRIQLERGSQCPTCDYLSFKVIYRIVS
jgi:hypothetical protein